MKQRTQCKQIVCPFIHPRPPDGVKRSKLFFWRRSWCICHYGKTCRTLCKFDLMHTPDIFGWVKRSDIEKLSELVVFDYGSSDTQYDLRCLRNGIYNLWLTSLPCYKNSGERFRALLFIIFYMNPSIPSVTLYQLSQCVSLFIFVFIIHAHHICW